MVLLQLLLAASAMAETHRVINEVNYHTFSKEHPIQSRLKPGDRVITKTVDSAGFDYAGVRHTKTHGNPLTGPFYIEGAEPGDALIIHLEKVRLNRDTGYTAFRVGALPNEAKARYAPPPYQEGAVLPGRTDIIPFVIDRKAGIARPKESLSSKVSLAFPVAPMLGCIGVAPDMEKPPTSGPAGTYGGNMDYKEVREGATVMLPVSHTGAYFFIGDGHALEGDGEAVGSGIETSLDVEFRIELKKGAKLTGPRLENAEYLISVGGRTAETNSLNDALAAANADMLRWLVEDYGLEPVAAHLLIGHTAKYDIATLAGVIGIKIPKKALAPKR